jgi:hypothetical protein
MPAIALLALQACDDDEGFVAQQTTSSASAGGASSSNGSTTSAGGGNACVDLGDGCTQCELERCNESYCDCYESAECGLLATCTFACGDLACVQDCYEQHPQGISDAVLLFDCAAGQCPASSECEAYIYPGYVPLTGCQTCLYDKCPSQMNLCVANEACPPLLLCLEPCGANTTCQEECYAMHPEGENDANAVGICLLANCSTPCGF